MHTSVSEPLTRCDAVHCKAALVVTTRFAPSLIISLQSIRQWQRSERKYLDIVKELTCYHSSLVIQKNQSRPKPAQIQSIDRSVSDQYLFHPLHYRSSWIASYRVVMSFDLDVERFYSRLRKLQGSFVKHQ